MATLTYTIPDSNFNSGEDALGSDVRTRFTNIKTFLEGANLDANNLSVSSVFAWTNRHTWTVSDSSNDNRSLTVSAVMDASKYGDKVYSNAAQVNSALRYTEQDNASSTADVDEVKNDGTGSARKVTQVGDGIGSEVDIQTTSNTKAAFKATQAGTGHCYEGELRTLTGLNAPMVAAIITTPTSVDNTGTETEISDLTLTLPANFLKAGTTIRGKLYGELNTPSAGTPSAQLRLYYDSTELLDSGAVTLSDNLADSLVVLDFTLTCISTGASGTIEAQGMLSWGSNTAPVNRGMGTPGTGDTNDGVITIDTTASSDLALKFQWGSGVSGAAVSFRAGTVEIVR